MKFLIVQRLVHPRRSLLAIRSTVNRTNSHGIWQLDFRYQGNQLVNKLLYVQ